MVLTSSTILIPTANSICGLSVSDNVVYTAGNKASLSNSNTKLYANECSDFVITSTNLFICLRKPTGDASGSSVVYCNSATADDCGKSTATLSQLTFWGVFDAIEDNVCGVSNSDLNTVTCTSLKQSGGTLVFSFQKNVPGISKTAVRI